MQVLIANCEVIHVDWHMLVVNLCVNKQIINFILVKTMNQISFPTLQGRCFDLNQ